MKLSSIILIIIIALVALAFVGWSKAPDWISARLSKGMQVKVVIDDIDLATHAITVQKVSIGSPKGSLLPKSFSCERILLEAPLTRYLDQHVDIEQINLDHVYLGLEFEAKGSKEGNWSTIMRNMKTSSPATIQPQETSKTSRSVLIKKLVITDIAIDLVYKNEGGTVRHLAPIDRLEFTNISSEGGIPADQITQLVLAQTLRSVFEKENLENMLEDVFNMPKTTLEQFTGPFKSLFN